VAGGAFLIFTCEPLHDDDPIGFHKVVMNYFNIVRILRPNIYNEVDLRYNRICFPFFSSSNYRLSSQEVIPSVVDQYELIFWVKLTASPLTVLFSMIFVDFIDPTILK